MQHRALRTGTPRSSSWLTRRTRTLGSSVPSPAMATICLAPSHRHAHVRSLAHRLNPRRPIFVSQARALQAREEAGCEREGTRPEHGSDLPHRTPTARMPDWRHDRSCSADQAHRLPPHCGCPRAEGISHGTERATPGHRRHRSLRKNSTRAYMRIPATRRSINRSWQAAPRRALQTLDQCRPRRYRCAGRGSGTFAGSPGTARPCTACTSRSLRFDSPR